MQAKARERQAKIVRATHGGEGRMRDAPRCLSSSAPVSRQLPGVMGERWAGDNGHQLSNAICLGASGIGGFRGVKFGRRSQISELVAIIATSNPSPHLSAVTLVYRGGNFALFAKREGGPAWAAMS